MKEITIGGVSYPVKSNALTRLHYKKLFGVGIFQDISKMSIANNVQEELRATLKAQGKTKKEIKEAVNNEMLKYTDDILDIAFRFAYVLIYTANPNFMTFEEWLSEESMNKIDFESGWIQEATEYITSTFRG